MHLFTFTKEKTKWKPYFQWDEKLNCTWNVLKENKDNDTIVASLLFILANTLENHTGLIMVILLLVWFHVEHKEIVFPGRV